MSIHQDIPALNIQIHLCTVERVHKSGLIDARSDRDRFFEQINTTYFGAEGNYVTGSRCIVVTDGSQYLSLGQINEPAQGDDGTTTIKNLRNDLAELVNARSLVSVNSMGMQAKVVVSPGAGVVLDSGDNAIVHLDPGNAKINEIADRKETITVPFFADHDHDGVVAQSEYKWRTLADNLSWDRDVKRERDDSLDLGAVLTAKIGPSPNVLNIEHKFSGALLSSIEIGQLGNITIKGSSSTVEVSPIGVNITTGSGPLTGQITVDSAGRLKLGSNSIDLLDTISDVIQEIENAQVVTLLGPQPIITAPLFTLLRTVQLALIKG